MRGKVLILLIVFIGISLWATTILAQTEEKKAEEQKPQLILVEEVAVKPSKVAEYEAHVKEVLELSAKYEFPYQFYAFSYDDFHYRFGFPIENFSDIDNFYEVGEELSKKMGPEQYESLAKSAIGTYDYLHLFLIHYRPDLSYIPEELEFKLWEEEHFIFSESCYLEYGKEKEYDETIKKWVELYKSKNIPVGWWTYVGHIGTKMPFYMFVIRAKSAVDYYSQSAKIQEQMGEEIKKLMGKTWSPVRKFEVNTGRFRPDLSYLPKEEKPKE